jgi:glycosyltransferase 2 family protein
MSQLLLAFQRLLGRPLVWVGVAVSAAAVALALRGLDVGEVAHTLRTTNVLWLIPAVAALLIALYPRVRRWEVLFYPTTGVSQGSLFGAMNVGYMLNNLLPLRVGELGRAAVIARTEDVDYARALSTILVERVLDILVLFGLLMALLPFVDEPQWMTRSAIVLGVGTLSLAALLALAASFRNFAAAIARRLLRRASPSLQARGEGWVSAALTGFAALSEPRVLVEALFWSVLGWACSSVFLFCCLQALNMHMSYAAPLLVMVAINLGMVIPSSSGYVGVYHAIVIETMTAAFAVTREQALSFAIISHALFYVTPILLGVGYLWNRRELWQDTVSKVLSPREAKEAHQAV